MNSVHMLKSINLLIVFFCIICTTLIACKKTDPFSEEPVYSSFGIKFGNESFEQSDLGYNSYAKTMTSFSFKHCYDATQGKYVNENYSPIKAREDSLLITSDLIPFSSSAYHSSTPITDFLITIPMKGVETNSIVEVESKDVFLYWLARIKNENGISDIVFKRVQIEKCEVCFHWIDYYNRCFYGNISMIGLYPGEEGDIPFETTQCVFSLVDKRLYDINSYLETLNGYIKDSRQL